MPKYKSVRIQFVIMFGDDLMFNGSLVQVDVTVCETRKDGRK